MRRVLVQPGDFSPASLIEDLERLGGGAVASFTGLVRAEQGLVALELDHYPAMTAPAIERIVEAAEARWPLLGAIVVHRVGRLAPGERIVFAGTASSHRAAALDACHYLIDRLKTDAPFWKKQHFADGSSGWVEARATDSAAAARWSGGAER